MYNTPPDRSQTVTQTSILAIARPIVTYNKVLNDMELKIIDWLRIAVNQTLNESYSSRKFCINIKTEREYCGMFANKVVDQMILRVMKFFKRITKEKKICTDDRITLFRCCCWPAVVIKGLVDCNYEQEYFTNSMVSAI